MISQKSRPFAYKHAEGRPFYISRVTTRIYIDVAINTLRHFLMSGMVS